MPEPAPSKGRATPGLSLKGRALKYLAAREHSRLELARKLARHAQGGTDAGGHADAHADGPAAAASAQVEAVLDELEARGLLSAERFAASVLHRKAAKFGAARLQAELAQHQLLPDIARDATQALRDTEFERALALWQRRYGEVATTPQDKARQMRFLAARGFAGDVIRRVVRGDGGASD